MLVLSLHLADLRRAFDFRGLFDLIELRISEAGITAEEEHLLLSLKTPILLTLEKESFLHNASWSITPQIVDLPWDASVSSIATARKLFPDALLQGSFHSFDQKEMNLPSLAESICRAGFDSVKIATMTHTATEVISLLGFQKSYSTKMRLTCVPMGEIGQFGRVLAMTMGSYLSYCCLPGSPTAPGQIDIATMHSLYAAPSLSTKTSCFALIGEHVATSPSHRTHTKLLRSFGIDGLYVKIPVKKEEAKSVLSLLESLGLYGLSVTTPLKDSVGSFSLPINTVKWTTGALEGINTDSPALLEAIEERILLNGAKVLLIGAGAVASATLPVLQEAGASVWVYNRTYETSCRLTQERGGTPLSDQEFAHPLHHFDVVVNATSAHFASLFPNHLTNLPFAAWKVRLAAEFAFPSKSPFLKAAAEAGVSTVSGLELWIRQAAKQFKWWCGIDEQQALDYLQKEFSYSSREIQQ